MDRLDKRQTDRQTAGRIDGWMDRQTDEWTERQTDELAVGQTNRWTDRPTGHGQTDKQIDG